jgi:uncharacterized protein (TIGR00251 family)
VELTVRVVPRAARDAIMETTDQAVRIRLTAPPVEGKANRALAAFLARRLGVPERDVVLLAGERNRMKRILIRGMSEAGVRRLVERV